MTGDTAFLWMVWGHHPDTDLPVYQSDEVTIQLLDQMNGGVFYIDYGGVYVGISSVDINGEALMAVIDSIRQPDIGFRPLANRAKYQEKLYHLETAVLFLNLQ